jgi:hypothetical protein
MDRMILLGTTSGTTTRCLARHEPAPYPEQVSVALAELVGEVRKGLLALTVDTGLPCQGHACEQPGARLFEPALTCRNRS